MTIGDWVRRDDPSRTVDEHRWHLVESIVADAAITKCGRRMEPVTENKMRPLEVWTRDVAPAVYEGRCRRCAP